MDIISKIQETDLIQIVAPSKYFLFSQKDSPLADTVAAVAAFGPLLENNRSHIESVTRITFRYGSTDRHQLDIYYPVEHNGSAKTPVLIWAYGGGFTTGDRRLEQSRGIIYGCVGAYFARKGFIVVIPDYRLAPKFTFPSAAEDIRDAMIWVIQHPEHLTTSTSPNPDINGIFVMGHSAGATHVFASLMLPETPESVVLHRRIAGAILHAGALHTRDLSPETDLYSAVVQHYNGEERVQEDDPMGLLRRADDTTVATLPRIIVVEGEKEPAWLLTAGADFCDAIEARVGKRPEWLVAKHHNHISAIMALSAGEGEEWAESVIEWIKHGA